jgi:trigger factor
MKTEIKRLPASRVAATITFDAQEFYTLWQAAYEAARVTVRVKGFRPGSAPRELADPAIDKEAVLESAVRRAAEKAMRTLADEHEWIIVDTPRVEVIEAHPPEPDTDSAKKPGLVFRASFPIFPEVKLGDYRKVARKVFANLEEPEVSKEDIARSIEWLMDSRATETRVQRPAARGDLLEIDIESSVDGVPIPGGAQSGDRFMLGKSRYIPGTDDALVGKHEGEIFSFTVHAPREYWQKELQDKDVALRGTVRAVFERRVPEFTDAFAQTIGPQFKTVADIEENIAEGLRHERQEKVREQARARVIQEIIGQSTIEVPDIMVEKTLAAMVAEARVMMRGAAADSPEEKLRDTLRGSQISCS